MNLKILVSAFEPFDKQPENSSLLVQKALSAKNDQLHTVTLPVEFEQCWRILHESIEKLKPDWVFCLGQAENRTVVSLERVALNWWDARIPDNRGFQPVDRVIVKGAPEALFTSAPARDLAEIMSASGVPAEVSYHAGTYVCNDLYFRVLEDSIAQDYGALFIHWPLLQEQQVSGELKISTITADAGADALLKVFASL